MPKKVSNVDKWNKRETSHQRKALENASKHFDEQDSLTVNHLQAIYGKESSYGSQRRKRAMEGAAGDFMLEKATAIRMGLNVTKENDQRFDIDDASAASAKYLKTLDSLFKEKKYLGNGIKSTPIFEKKERLKFAIAAFNAGEGRIAKAQEITKKNGGDPAVWNEVKEYLSKAGANSKKVKEITDYVDTVLEYSNEFAKKSKADKKSKFKKPDKMKNSPKGGHWITKDGYHILIRD